MERNNNSIEFGPIIETKDVWFVRNVEELTPIFGVGPFELNGKTVSSRASVEHVGIIFFRKGKYLFKRCKAKDARFPTDEHVYVVTAPGTISQCSGGERRLEAGDVLFGRASRLMKARSKAHVMKDTWQSDVADRMVKSIFGTKQ